MIAKDNTLRPEGGCYIDNVIVAPPYCAAWVRMLLSLADVP
jgi:hypothetical protein